MYRAVDLSSSSRFKFHTLKIGKPQLKAGVAGMAQLQAGAVKMVQLLAESLGGGSALRLIW
jgi:hypothetical protein